MSDKLTEAMSALQQLGATDYRSHQHDYASANAPQIRRQVARKRTVYGTGVGVASVAAAGAIVFAASTSGARQPLDIGPATSQTAPADDAVVTDASPSPHIDVTGSDNRPGEVVGEESGTTGASVVAPGTDAESILAIGAKSIDVSVDELRAAVIAALPAEAGGNYEGWLGVRGALDLSDATADDLARFLTGSTIANLEASGVAPADYEETLIKASLIAASGVPLEQWPMVAAVIDNRLDQGIALELDATVRFAKRGEAGDFDDSPTQVDGRYNTYQNVGLPPGPIGSTSAAAIDAVAHPAQSDALFFVTVNPTTGETRFTGTFGEHEQNIWDLEDWVREHPDYVWPNGYDTTKTSPAP